MTFDVMGTAVANAVNFAASQHLRQLSLRLA